MELIDNINRLLGDDIKQVLKPGVRLKVAASCFSIYAFEALKAALEQVDEHLFIFTSPTFVAEEVTDKIRKERREFHIPRLNLFVIFGEPDIDLLPEPDGRLRLKVNGVDVFKPQAGEVVSDGADGIACWFIDTDYNQESFFVRHADFLGASDPYSALKTTLKAEIDAGAWARLNSDTSRAFEKPKNGRIAVKVINHLGDEVMKVFRV